MDLITSRSHITAWRTPKTSIQDGGTPRTSVEHHKREVEKIAANVRDFHQRKQPFRIFHGGTNSTRKSALGRDPKKVIDTSRLNHVVRIDVATMTALVEPNVPMDREYLYRASKL